MNRMGSSWTEEQDAELRRLITEGHTMSAIASMIGDGKSKMAVIGRAHRLGISPGHRKASPPASVEKVREARSAAMPRPPTPPKKLDRPTKTAPLAVPPAVAALSSAPVKASVRGWPKPKTATAVTIFGLTGKTCRMPLFDGHEPIESKFYCGAPCEIAVPYCPACTALTQDFRSLSSTARAA